jgi:hypothetical protein
MMAQPFNTLGSKDRECGRCGRVATTTQVTLSSPNAATAAHLCSQCLREMRSLFAEFFKKNPAVGSRQS